MIEPTFLIDGGRLRPIASISFIQPEWAPLLKADDDWRSPDAVAIEFQDGSQKRMEGDDALRFLNWLHDRTISFDGSYPAAQDVTPITLRKNPSGESVLDSSGDRLGVWGGNPLGDRR